MSVQLSWTDTHGELHGAFVDTIDLSAHGMRIRHAGIQCKQGDSVAIACGAYSMRFRVVWIGTPGAASAGEAALLAEVAGEDTSKLALHLAQVRAGAREIPPAIPDHRWNAMPRYRCECPVQILREGQIFAASGTLRDFSLTGCFVQMPAPFSVGTALHLTISLFGMTARLQGVVQSCLAGEGMGVHFTALQPLDVLPLTTVLEELAHKEMETATRPKRR